MAAAAEAAEAAAAGVGRELVGALALAEGEAAAVAQRLGGAWRSLLSAAAPAAGLELQQPGTAARIGWWL